MIIDAHAHFEPALLDLERLIERMKKRSISKTVLISRVTDPPVYKKSDAVMGIQRSMMHFPFFHPLLKCVDNGFHSVPGQWNPWFRSMTGKPALFKILTEPDNQSVADAIKQYPQHLLGWIFINPKNTSWQSELQRWQKIPGMVGVKVHPFWHRYTIKEVYPVAEALVGTNLPLLVHLGFDDLKEVRRFCTSFPKLNIIIAHAAKPFYGDLWSTLKTTSNCYVDLAGHHVDESIVKNVVRVLGPQRCLFGTDDPYGEQDFFEQLKLWIDNLSLAQEDKELILGKNFVRICQGVVKHDT